jgi:crotonobetainyl-CoA:carnitine CoA-transferase CaiB-like acyl-CoA transferase
MLRDIGEVLQHPHMTERGLLQDALLPSHERPLGILGPGFAVVSDNVSSKVPTLGADTDAVLGELGLSLNEIAALRDCQAI